MCNSVTLLRFLVLIWVRSRFVFYLYVGFFILSIFSVAVSSSSSPTTSSLDVINTNLRSLIIETTADKVLSTIPAAFNDGPPPTIPTQGGFTQAALPIHTLMSAVHVEDKANPKKTDQILSPPFTTTRTNSVIQQVGKDTPNKHNKPTFEDSLPAAAISSAAEEEEDTILTNTSSIRFNRNSTSSSTTTHAGESQLRWFKTILSFVATMVSAISYKVLTFFLQFFAILSSIVMLLTPLPTLYKIQRRKNTADIEPLPYVMILFSAILWLFYGFLKKDLVIILPNTCGVILGGLYGYIYFLHCYNENNKSIFNFCIKLCGIFLTVLGIASYSKGIHQAGLALVGLAAAFFNVINYAAPLSSVGRVLRQKSCASMPHEICFGNFLCSVLWLLYGSVIGDKFIFIPSLLGSLVGAAQVGLLVAYPSRGGFEPIINNNENKISNNSPSVDPHSTKLETNLPSLLYSNVSSRHTKINGGVGGDGRDDHENVYYDCMQPEYGNQKGCYLNPCDHGLHDESAYGFDTDDTPSTSASNRSTGIITSPIIYHQNITSNHTNNSDHGSYRSPFSVYNSPRGNCNAPTSTSMSSSYCDDTINTNKIDTSTKVDFHDDNNNRTITTSTGTTSSGIIESIYSQFISPLVFAKSKWIAGSYAPFPPSPSSVYSSYKRLGGSVGGKGAVGPVGIVVPSVLASNDNTSRRGLQTHDSLLREVFGSEHYDNCFNSTNDSNNHLNTSGNFTTGAAAVTFAGYNI